MAVTRREFLGNLAAATAAGCMGNRLAAAEPAFPIVDTHQHLWDPAVLAPQWLKPGNPLHKRFSSQEYREATAGLGITRAVYMEVDMAPENQLAEADSVLEVCRRGDAPTCAAVLGGRPGSKGFRDYITRFKGNRYVKGVREIFRETAASAEFLAGLRLLGELGMCFDLCFPPNLLPEAAKVVDACPDTRFVLDHCGNADPRAFSKSTERPSHDPDKWRADIAAIAKRKNVVCKISGIIARVEPNRWTPDDLAPIVNHCLDSFGPDRVMFAGDWPVCTKGAPLREWVLALQAIVAGRPEAERRKLFHDNAIRFYGLTH